MTTYKSNGNAWQVTNGNGEVIEEFESRTGCLYADLGMCQGCPECRIKNEEED